MSKVVSTDNKGNAIVARLNWSVAPSSKRKLNRHVRSIASAIDAKRYVLNEEDESGLIGLETDDILEEGTEGIKKRHAFALLCRNFLATEEAEIYDAIFFMQIDGADTSRHALCVIRDGEIHLDTVEVTEKARMLVQSTLQDGACPVFSNVEDENFPTEEVHWEDLMGLIAKSTLLVSIPLNPLIPGGIALAVLAAVASFGYYQFVFIPHLEAERARKAAEADKTLEYVKALNRAAESVGWVKHSIQQELNSLEARNYFVKGWTLHELSCDRSRCIEKWSRTGGLLEDLLSVSPQSSLMASERFKADEVVLERSIQGQSAELDLATLPNGPFEIQTSFQPVVQFLDNAGSDLSFSKTEPWPRFSGIRNVKDKSVIVRATKFMLQTTYPFSVDTISYLPDNVILDKFTLSTSSPKQFTMKLEGNGYVR